MRPQEDARRTTLAFVLAALGLMVLGGVANAWVAPDPLHASDEVARRFLLRAPFAARDAGLFPEPHERTLVFLLTLSAPLGVLLATALVARLPSPSARWAQARWLLAAMGVGLVAGPLGRALRLFWRVTEGAVLAASLAAGLVAVGWQSRRASPSSRWSPWATAVLAGLVTAAFRYRATASVGDAYWDVLHLDAVAYSVAQIVGGARCLDTVVAQYGCYGEWMASLVRAVGPSVSSLSATMVGLTVMGLVGVIVWAERALATAALRPLAVVSMLGLMSYPIALGYDDPYYQYHPIRSLFAMLSLALVAQSGEALTLARAAAWGSVGALALSFNFDAGVAVVGSLLVSVMASSSLLVSRPVWRRALEETAAFVSGLAVTLAGLIAVQSLRAGHFVDVSGAMRYASIFYQAGFWMMPMPAAPSPWHAVVGVYLALLVKAADPTGEPARRRVSLHLAVLGVGLFAYYTGRSHPWVLASCAWPAVLGVAVLLDGARAVQSAWGQRISSGLAMGVAVLLVALGLQTRFGVRGAPLAPTDRPLTDAEVAFVRSRVGENETMLVLSDHQGALLLSLGRAQRPWQTGLVETILREDGNRLVGALVRAEAAHVLVSPRYLAQPSHAWLAEGWRAASSQYERGAVSPSGRLVHYRRRASLAP